MKINMVLAILQIILWLMVVLWLLIISLKDDCTPGGRILYACRYPVGNPMKQLIGKNLRTKMVELDRCQQFLTKMFDPKYPKCWRKKTITPWKLTCPLKKDYFNRNYIHLHPLTFRGSIRYFSEKHLPPKKSCWPINSENEAFPDFFLGGKAYPPSKKTAKAPANGPGPKKEISSSNHQFSGAKPLVSPSASWPGQPS